MGSPHHQVVLANGQIHNVNRKSNPDLYFALRGGGNNFAIVTRFDLETFTQGLMWGGLTVHPSTTNASILNAFENLANDATENSDAGLTVTYIYFEGSYVFANNYEYALPTPFPPAFEEFTSIPNITSTQRITTLSDLTIELNVSSPDGFRQHFTTATFRVSAAFQLQILDIFVEEMDSVINAVGIQPGLVMQPITLPMIRLFRKNGGNALGIDEEDGPLNLIVIVILWSDAADDERIISAAARVISRTNDIARRLGLENRFLYQNYASLGQDVFGSYGEENRRRLLEISRKYDPDQVFQNLQPGYFKLDGQNGGSLV